MKRFFISKSADVRRERIAQIMAQAPGPVIYLSPKNLQRQHLPGVYCATYEDINQKNVWLHLNDLLSEETTIVLENPTRYPKITSPKFKNLQRLCMRSGQANVHIVDIVPFTLKTEYLYSACSYLDRGILGYPHYYAFRENYEEMHRGRIVHAHDPDLLAGKLAAHMSVDYAQFSNACQTVTYASTAQETVAYQQLRERCFANANLAPRKIVTKLADHVHAHDSRFKTLRDLLQALPGDAVIYCNLNSYAARINRKLKASKLADRCWATSYQLGTQRSADHVVYMESPIVRTYYLLDAEAHHSGADTYHICGDQKVDTFLYQTVRDEIAEIDALTKELYHASK